MDASAKRSARLLIRALVGASLIGVLLWSAGPARLLETLTSISPGYLFLAFLAQAAAKLVWAMRWREVLRVCGIRKGMIELLAMLHVGFFFNNFLPSSMGGDVVRGYYSADGKGTLATAYGVVLAERLIGLVALAAVCALAVAGLLIEGDSTVPSAFLWSCLAASAAFFGAGGVAFLSDHWTRALPLVLRRRPRLSAVAANVANAVQFVRRPGCRVLLVIGLSVSVQVIAVLFYFATARAVGITLDLATFFFVVPLAVVASMIPIAPNGIGLREGAFVGLLQLLGVATSTATAFALLARLVDLAFGLVGGAVFVLDPTFKRADAPRSATLRP